MWLSVRVMPKRGVRNPQGEAVLAALNGLGFDSVKEVRQGKLLRLDIDCSGEVEGKRQLKKMCETLLANDTIEQFEID